MHWCGSRTLLSHPWWYGADTVTYWCFFKMRCRHFICLFFGQRGCFFYWPGAGLNWAGETAAFSDIREVLFLRFITVFKPWKAQLSLGLSSTPFFLILHSSVWHKGAVRRRGPISHWSLVRTLICPQTTRPLAALISLIAIGTRLHRSLSLIFILQDGEQHRHWSSRGRAGCQENCLLCRGDTSTHVILVDGVCACVCGCVCFV